MSDIKGSTTTGKPISNISTQNIEVSNTPHQTGPARADNAAVPERSVHHEDKSAYRNTPQGNEQRGVGHSETTNMKIYDTNQEQVGPNMSKPDAAEKVVKSGE